MGADTLVLEHLRAIRVDIGELKETMREIKDQLGGTVHREVAQDGDLARHDRQIMRLREDVDRIKRRRDPVED